MLKPINPLRPIIKVNRIDSSIYETTDNIVNNSVIHPVPLEILETKINGNTEFELGPQEQSRALMKRWPFPSGKNVSEAPQNRFKVDLETPTSQDFPQLTPIPKIESRLTSIIKKGASVDPPPLEIIRSQKIDTPKVTQPDKAKDTFVYQLIRYNYMEDSLTYYSQFTHEYVCRLFNQDPSMGITDSEVTLEHKLFKLISRFVNLMDESCELTRRRDSGNINLRINPNIGNRIPGLGNRIIVEVIDDGKNTYEVGEMRDSEGPSISDIFVVRQLELNTLKKIKTEVLF